jgi:hypothetical protein
MSDDADTAFAFWTAPIGGFVLAVLLTLPMDCTGSILTGDQQCTNVLGFKTLVLDQASSWFLGVVVGAASWGLVKAFQHFSGPGK